MLVSACGINYITFAKRVGGFGSEGREICALESSGVYRYGVGISVGVFLRLGGGNERRKGFLFAGDMF